MSSFTFANIMGGMIFSGIGFIAFTYGKRNGNFRAMALGALLMSYSYIVPSTALVYLVGTGLTALLWIGWE